MEELFQLKSDIRAFSFEKCNGGSQGFKRLLLQLFGFLGHGKSSFINTCKYVLDERDFRNVANARKPNGGGITTARRPYPLTQTITLVDNRGCASMNDYETGEIFAQLANLLPVDEEVEWKEGLGLMDKVFAAEYKVNNSDFIVPVFIYSVTNKLPRQEEDSLREMFFTARNLTGIFPIVVLTHKDQGNVSECKSLFRNMGVERVIAVENYTDRNHTKTRGRDEEVLRLLMGVIKDVEFRMAYLQNPEKDIRNRMHFILKYISEREIRLVEVRKDVEKMKDLAAVTMALKKVRTSNETEREHERVRHQHEMRHQREKMEMEREKERALLEAEMRKLQEEIEKFDLRNKNRTGKQKKEPCALQ